MSKCPACGTICTIDRKGNFPAACPRCGCGLAIPRVDDAAPPKQKGAPASERQKEYARELGIRFPIDIGAREISKLIDEAVNERDAKRFDRLDELERREAAAADGAKLSTADESQMLGALGDRGLSAILITLRSDGGIDFSDLTGVKVEIDCTSDMKEYEMKAMICFIAQRLTEG